MIRLLAIAGLLFVGMCARADDPMPKPAKEKPAPAEEIDVAKTTERIVQDANEAGKRLAAKDPGDQTQRVQKDILDNLDALIRKAQQPPPPMNGGGASSSSGNGMGDGNSRQPMGGDTSSAAAARKQRREQRNSQANGGRSTQPRPGSAGQRLDPMKVFGGPSSAPNKIEPKGALPHLPDVYKNVWGHLPEKMRQEMDLYFREQFMPRYSDLLRQYYSSLAERGGKKNP